jgi:hypothetical protein
MEHGNFKSVRQFPGRILEVLAIEYIHHTRQLCKFGITMNEVKE